MDKSCEAAAFQRCFSLLQKGLQYELGTIVPALYSESLISSEHRDQCLSRNEPSHERATHLLSVLESRIHVDPASLHLIIRELDSFPTLQTLASKLRSELKHLWLEQVKRAKLEQQQRPSAELQVAATGTVHDDSISVTASSQSACVCPIALDVQQQIHSLKGQFANLVMQLISMLTILESKSDDTVHRVRAAVLAIPLSLKKEHCFFLEYHRSTFTQASSVTEILDTLCSYWDYLNVSLFEHMVMMFGRDEVKTEFKTYLEQLSEFRQKTKLGDFIDALGEDRTALPPEFVEVQVKMGSSWDNRTLEDAVQLRLRQCRKAEIASYGLYFTGGKRKCIILTWRVAEMAVSSLLSALDDAEQRECDILAIDYNAPAPVIDTLPTVEDTAETDVTEEEGPAVVPSVPSSSTPIEGATGGSDAPVIASGSDTTDITEKHKTHQKRRTAARTLPRLPWARSQEHSCLAPRSHHSQSLLAELALSLTTGGNRESRKAEAASIRAYFPQKVPVIVERSRGDRDLPLLDKTKFLVPGELTMSQFVTIIRNRMGLSNTQPFYLLVNNKSLSSMSITMSKVYVEEKDADGFLYMTYSAYEYFGGGNCIVL